jgi:hypothetical protein
MRHARVGPTHHRVGVDGASDGERDEDDGKPNFNMSASPTRDAGT